MKILSNQSVITLQETANYELQSYTKLIGFIVSVSKLDSVKFFYDMDNMGTLYDTQGNPMYQTFILDNSLSTDTALCSGFVPVNRYVKRFVYTTLLATGNSNVQAIFDFTDVQI